MATQVGLTIKNVKNQEPKKETPKEEEKKTVKKEK